MAAAAVVDGRDTGFPFPAVETGITPFGGDFSLATTQIDAANDKLVLFGPFPANNVYLTKLEVYASDMDSGAGLVWDISKGDLDGTIDSSGEVIDGSTAGQAAGGDSLDADNIMFDMADSAGVGKYLVFHVKTASATPVAGTLSVYGEYVNGMLKAHVD
jgi:hypothetical protein